MRQDIERLTSARSAAYNGSTFFEYEGDQFARICIVVDDQQAQAFERARAFDLVVLFDRGVIHVARVRCLNCHRKLHCERCSLSFSRAFGPHTPTMKLYEMLHNRQPEP